MKVGAFDNGGGFRLVVQNHLHHNQGVIRTSFENSVVSVFETILGPLPITWLETRRVSSHVNLTE